MNLVQPGVDPIKFVSSAEAELPDRDLLSIKYRRVQKASPEFATIYEGIDQSVDIQISTFIFRAAPEPLVDLYDFIMTTFVPQSTDQNVQIVDNQPIDLNTEPTQRQEGATDKIRVIVKLASVEGWCSNFL